MKLPAFALLLVLLPACFSARASVGPNLSTGTAKGVTAGGGIGMGWSFDGDKAIYAVPTFGVVASDHANALIVESISYVDYGLALPVRIDARIGAVLGREKFDEEGRTLLGAAVAVLPWHGKTSSGRTRSEKGWGDFGPDLDALRGLGLEVAVDVLPAPSSNDRTTLMATFSVVGDMSLMAR